MRQLYCGQERLRGGRSFILVVQIAKNMKMIAYEFYTKERGSIKFAVNRQEDGGEFVPYLTPRAFQAQQLPVGSTNTQACTAIRKQYLFTPGKYEFTWRNEEFYAKTVHYEVFAC